MSIPMVNTATEKTGSPTIGLKNVRSTVELSIPVNKIAKMNKNRIILNTYCILFTQILRVCFSEFSNVSAVIKFAGVSRK